MVPTVKAHQPTTDPRPRRARFTHVYSDNVSRRGPRTDRGAVDTPGLSRRASERSRGCVSCAPSVGGGGRTAEGTGRDIDQRFRSFVDGPKDRTPTDSGAVTWALRWTDLRLLCVRVSGPVRGSLGDERGPLITGRRRHRSVSGPSRLSGQGVTFGPYVAGVASRLSGVTSPAGPGPKPIRAPSILFPPVHVPQQRATGRGTW